MPRQYHAQVPCLTANCIRESRTGIRSFDPRRIVVEYVRSTQIIAHQRVRSVVGTPQNTVGSKCQGYFIAQTIGQDDTRLEIQGKLP